jgi:hypothetical protein
VLDDESPKRLINYIPFRTVLKASRIKPRVMIQNAYAETKGIITNCAITAMTARITEIHQKFFVGAFNFMILSSIMW